jgi:uncharacterized Tic20 family protein
MFVLLSTCEDLEPGLHSQDLKKRKRQRERDERETKYLKTTNVLELLLLPEKSIVGPLYLWVLHL